MGDSMNSTSVHASDAPLDAMIATPMEFVVNGRFLQRRVTGVERCGVELLRVLERQASDTQNRGSAIRPTIVAPVGTYHDHPFRHLRLRKLPAWFSQGHLWEQLVLPFVSPRATLVNFANSAPLLRHRQMVFIHDAGIYDIPECYTPAYRTFYRLLYGGLQHTRTIIGTASQSAAERLAFHLPRLANRIFVVPLGADHMHRIEPDAGALDRYGLEPGRYVLAVASAAKHKNMRLLGDAADRITTMGLKIAIVGGQRSAIFGDADRGLTPGIVRLGYVDDPALRALYEAAYAFVFPSLYEGFGLPPLEAMTLGCPTIVSRIRPLTDNCLDGAMHVDPDDPSELVEALRQLQDPEFRLGVAMQGRARAAQFTWEAATRRLLKQLAAAHACRAWGGSRSLPGWDHE